MVRRGRGVGAIRLVRGDITREAADAIVNAANRSLQAGGGVDGAIHRAGGPSIQEECNRIRAARGECPAGEAVVTTAGNLSARIVIHTVGPVWHGGDRSEDELLAACYRSSLRLAEENGCRTVAFPSISTGAYRFPVERAARIALRTVWEELEGKSIEEVRFVLFSEGDLETYRKALAGIP